MELKIKETDNALMIAMESAEDRAELQSLIDDPDRSFWSIMAELFEPFSCNGSYEPFDAGDGDPFVGLTSAPCIAEAMLVDDDGKRSIDGNFWYFENYMLADPLEELATEGKTAFALAKD